MNYNKLFKKISGRKNFDFIASKDVFKYEDNQEAINNILNPPKELIELILMDSSGMINITEYDKFIILVNLHQGKIFIEEYDSSQWKVVVKFS